MIDRRTVIISGAATSLLSTQPAHAWVPFLMRMFIGAGVRGTAGRAAASAAARQAARQAAARAAARKAAERAAAKKAAQKSAAQIRRDKSKRMMSRMADVATLTMAVKDLLPVLDAYAAEYPNSPDPVVWYRDGENFFEVSGFNHNRKIISDSVTFECQSAFSDKTLCKLTTDKWDYEPNAQFDISLPVDRLPRELKTGTIFWLVAKNQHASTVKFSPAAEPVIIMDA